MSKEQELSNNTQYTLQKRDLSRHNQLSGTVFSMQWNECIDVVLIWKGGTIECAWRNWWIANWEAWSERGIGYEPNVVEINERLFRIATRIILRYKRLPRLMSDYEDHDSWIHATKVSTGHCILTCSQRSSVLKRKGRWISPAEREMYRQ